MNKRQKQIVHYLTKNKDKFSTTSELSKRYACTTRTIRNDINVIEKYANTYGVNVIRKSNKGIKLEINQTYINEFLKKVLDEEDFGQQESKIRKYHVLILLLMSNKPINLDYLATKFYTPKNNIREDLDQTMYLIRKYQLELTIKKGVGIVISGNEINKRELLSFLTKRLNEKTNSRKTLYELFDADEINVVNQAISLISDDLKANIEESPINSISLHILFMIKRIKNNEGVIISAEEWQMLASSNIIEEAKTITTCLAKELKITFSEDEIGYLALRLFCLYTPNISNQDDQETKFLVIKLLEVVSELYDVDLKKDNILMTNLMSHMTSTLKRIKSGFHISNPVIHEIKKEYTQLFLILQMVLDEYFSESNLVFPEEEIGYIAVHFQAAFERIHNLQKSLKIIIVSSYGLGVASFIKAKINNKFPNIEVLDIMLANKFSSYARINEVSFILSTNKDIKNLGRKVLVVSPLIDEIDLQAIDSLIKETLENPQREFDIMKYSNPFLVHLDREEKNKYDLIKNLIQVLEKRNYVQKGLFMDSVINREKSSNTNVGEFIAIPHGNPDLVLESSISFAILKESIWWSDSHVKIVVLLALKKDSLMTGEIKNFFKILNEINSNRALVDQITTERRKLKILEYFSGNEIK